MARIRHVQYWIGRGSTKQIKKLMKLLSDDSTKYLYQRRIKQKRRDTGCHKVDASNDRMERPHGKDDWRLTTKSRQKRKTLQLQTPWKIKRWYESWISASQSCCRHRMTQDLLLLLMEGEEEVNTACRPSITYQ